MIDAAEGDAGGLRVWVDSNGDATTEAGEIRSLSDVGIAAIGLTVTAPKRRAPARRGDTQSWRVAPMQRLAA